VLLDRKKIRRRAKWVALGLAIAFALGFLFLGVGYGGAGFNLSELFSGGGCTETTEPPVTDTELDEALASLEADPDNTDLMAEVAGLYERRYNPDSESGIENLEKAAEYLERALSVDPDLKEIYLDLAEVYLQMGSATGSQDAYKDAARVLNKATSIDPENPDVYLYLGMAQRAAGEEGAAILAWQKYLELEPAGRQADAIREALEEMTAPSTTTTKASTTTTSYGSTATSVNSTSTTVD
jgi:cytochrome c-type biogenesis protein CcmH/NrfG